MVAAEGLVLSYYDDGDGTGELAVSASFDGFSGASAAYFSASELLQFAGRLSAFPLPDEAGIEIAGGYWSSTAEVLEVELVGLRVRPVRRRGQVGVRTHLSTRPDDVLLRHEVTINVLTSYEALRRFSSDLPALVRGEVSEVEVAAERVG